MFKNKRSHPLLNPPPPIRRGRKVGEDILLVSDTDRLLLSAGIGCKPVPAEKIF